MWPRETKILHTYLRQVQLDSFAVSLDVWIVSKQYYRQILRELYFYVIYWCIIYVCIMLGYFDSDCSKKLFLHTDNINTQLRFIRNIQSASLTIQNVWYFHYLKYDQDWYYVILHQYSIFGLLIICIYLLVVSNKEFGWFTVNRLNYI